MNKYLQIGLETLNFYSDTKFEKGLLLISRIEDYKKNNPQIYNVLIRASRFKGIHSVYCRFLEHQETIIPQIYIFDYTQVDFNKLAKTNFTNEIQRRLWSSSEVPLAFVFTRTEILIYNTHSIKNETFNFFEKIEILSEVNNHLVDKTDYMRKINNFSSDNFANGSFWEKEEYRNEFIASNNVYEKLIKHLRYTRIKLIKDPKVFKTEINLHKKIEIIHRLLVITILIKYLEEKTDSSNNSVFPKGFFSKYHVEATTFTEVLYYQGDIIRLLDDLSAHFHGEIFKVDDESKHYISQINLRLFAEFLEAKTDNNEQLSFWRLYCFRDLPVELISNIYESFLLEDKKYLSERNKKSDKEINGIVYTPPMLVNFLIDELIPLHPNETNINIKILDPSCGSGIFLVLAYKRLIHRWRMKNNWERPSKDVLKEILIYSIYGVDIKEDAIQLTAFSLTLALCDELEPKEIWENLTFDSLKQNLFYGNFFNHLENTFHVFFDIILGNPPFTKELEGVAKELEEKRTKLNLPPLPDNYSLTFLFLDQVPKLLTRYGTVCLLCPTDSLLVRNSDYKKYFFERFHIKYLIDFTPLRRILFSSASVAVTAVFYKNSLSITKEDIMHIVVRRTNSAKNKIFFELDKYDFHRVHTSDAIKYPYIFKSHYFGVSRRNFELIKKLDTLKKFKSFMYDNLNSRKNMADSKMLIVKKNIGVYALKTQIVDSPEYIDLDMQSESFTIKNKSFEELQKIEKYIKENYIFLKYFILNTSDRTALTKSNATILKKDFENSPFDENMIYTLSEIEVALVSDCVHYWNDFIGKGEKSLMCDSIKPSQLSILYEYSNVFLQIINSIYESYKADKPIILEESIVFPFYWGDKPSSLEHMPETPKHLRNLLKYLDLKANIQYNRVIIVYDKNVIYIIKPNQRRYWLKTVAIRDADEVFDYLVKQEYH